MSSLQSRELRLERKRETKETNVNVISSYAFSFEETEFFCLFLSWFVFSENQCFGLALLGTKCLLSVTAWCSEHTVTKCSPGNYPSFLTSTATQ